MRWCASGVCSVSLTNLTDLGLDRPSSPAIREFYVMRKVDGLNSMSFGIWLI